MDDPTDEGEDPARHLASLDAAGRLELDSTKGTVRCGSLRGVLPGQTAVISDPALRDALRRVREERRVKAVPSVLNARYRILRQIAEGGMGTILEAEQLALHRRVAIKTMRSGDTGPAVSEEEFLREALLTAQLDHPNIIPIYEIGSDAGSAFLSMKLVRGRTWHDLLHPPADDKDCVQIAAWMELVDHVEILGNVCRAMAFAHSRQILHRDIKPQNVMVGEFGEVYLMDWGLARATILPDEEDEATAGQIAGSPSYMAPEMVSGDPSRVDERSDVYLLGAVLHEVLWGVPPHPGDDLMKVLIDAARNRIATPAEGRAGNPVPEALRDTCLRALATKPADRHPDVSSFHHELRGFLLGSNLA